MKRRCENCVYFVEYFKGSKFGVCHRFPPKNGEFPKVGRTNWCGEFMPKNINEKLKKLKEDVNYIYELLKPLAQIAEDG